jgi:hypothetical protein
VRNAAGSAAWRERALVSQSRFAFVPRACLGKSSGLSEYKEMAGDLSHRPGREEMYSPVARLQQHVVQGLAQACTKRMQKTPALFFVLNFALRFVPSLSWQMVSVS